MAGKIVLVGGGGHAKVIIDAIRVSGKFDIAGIVDPKLPKGALILGEKVIGTDADLDEIFTKGVTNAFISVGSIGDCTIRKKVYDNLNRHDFKLPAIVHPAATVAKDVEIGEGTFIAAGVVINPGTKIGKNSIINTSSSIDHDCVIGDFVHVAPGVTLSGGVRIGDETHIGTGAKVTQYRTIGKNCMIGAGQIIRYSMNDGEKSYGKAVAGRKSNERVYIIAEAGVNHNGSLLLAKQLVDAAKRSGADAVKFQTFKTENVICIHAPKAQYQKRATCKSESQLEMLKKLELGPDAHKELIKYCRQKKITFMSAPFDLESVGLLKKLGLELLKIPSGEITNLPYLRKIGSLKKKVFLSTGMSDMDEVKKAVDVLVLAGTRKDDVTVMQCTTEYPAPYESANLNAIITMREALGVDTGYSDHTPGTEMAIAAVAVGATVIEKHFTLDKNMEGPDHKASLEPYELNNMVTAIRNVEKGLGDGIKRLLPAELKNRTIARKSIVAARSIRKGEIFAGSNITTKRPASGVSPMKWDAVIGKHAKKDYKKDDFIRL